MTDQILDFLIYQNQECPILAISSSEGLSKPTDFGIQAGPTSTACCRGYYMRYICSDDKLFLNRMTMWPVDEQNPKLHNDEHYPKVCDIEPFWDFGHLWSAMVYTGLRVSVPYTGGLVIGKDFRSGGGIINPLMYSYYQTMVELLFENGKLQKVTDYSDQVAAQREHKKDIEDVFSLKYDFFYTWTIWENKKTKAP